MQTEEPDAKWDYITYWSLPPAEMIDFVAPGYSGWRSGEEKGPYWGRIGRSKEWDLNRTGMQNFRLDGFYLGMIPLLFSLFSLFSCRHSGRRAEILFWGGASLTALLLAFGKFFPLIPSAAASCAFMGYDLACSTTIWTGTYLNH